MQLPPIKVELSTGQIANRLETAMRLHIEANGPPPGEYEQGFADAVEAMVEILRNAEAAVQKLVS